MFADELKKFRIEHKLTVAKMAEFLGVPFYTYEKWEYRQNVPDDFKKNVILEKLKKENNSHLN